MRDVFICHAGEDKQAVVHPLVAALQVRGVSCWVDEAEIMWGDSVTQKVNKGLAISRYVIVVLSSSFIGKNWPERELHAALNMEASSGEVKVLPLIVGDEHEQSQIRKQYSLLNDKLFISWQGYVEPVVDAVLKRLAKPQNSDPSEQVSKAPGRGVKNVYLPQMRKPVSQRDKDHFLKTAFETLKDYFQQALSQLEAHYHEVDTDFTEVHKEKFRCKIYVNGEIRNQCLVWIGGPIGMDSIGFSEGQRIVRDNSYNEIISVEEEGSDLYLKFSMGGLYYQQDVKHFNPEEAAEALWKRFSASLER